MAAAFTFPDSRSFHSSRFRQVPMSEPKPWFVQSRNWYTAMPVSRQGWALLIGVFATEVLVTRNLHGVVRAIAFFAIILLFFVVSRGKTTTQPPAP
jgi:hypothetical protein